MKDLDSAIKVLPDEPRNGEKGRVTKWTAMAYKARLLIYTQQWQPAIDLIETVKASNKYALQPSFDQVWTGLSAYRNGPETILAYNASVNDGEPSGNNGNYGERLNFPYSGSHFQCCGFNQPTQNLVNFFKTDAATGLPLVMVDSNTWNADNNMLDGHRNTVPVDPRIDYTVGRDSVPYKDWGLFSIADQWVRDVANGGPYSPKKNAQEKASGAESSSAGWQPQQENSVHIHIFRYADLLLMEAEAYVETNQLELARQIVNQIRDRAAVTAQGCGDASVAKTYAACTGNTSLTMTLNPMVNGVSTTAAPWADYVIGEYPGPWTDANYAREAIRTERRLELALEGQRLFDLRRWGQKYAADRINGFVGMGDHPNGEGGGMEKTRRTFLAAAEPFAAKHMLYPIPSLEIDESKVNGQPRLKQNPGW
jgi:hypothetical protein